jgi:hypothetical protein
VNSREWNATILRKIPSLNRPQVAEGWSYSREHCVHTRAQASTASLSFPQTNRSGKPLPSPATVLKLKRRYSEETSDDTVALATVGIRQSNDLRLASQQGIAAVRRRLMQPAAVLRAPPAHSEQPPLER